MRPLILPLLPLLSSIRILVDVGSVPSMGMFAILYDDDADDINDDDDSYDCHRDVAGYYNVRIRKQDILLGEVW